MGLIHRCGIVLSLCLLYFSVRAEEIFSGNIKIRTRAEDNLLEVVFGPDNNLIGQLGVALPSSVGPPTFPCDSPDGTTCLKWGDYAQIVVEDAWEGNDNCARIEWTSMHAKTLEDCFNIVDGAHWYGGGETWLHTWPIEDQRRPEVPVVTGGEFNGVTENYWLVSTGVALIFDEDNPLFFSLNSVRPNKVCYLAKDIHPYTKRSPLTLKYNLCLGDNVKDVHLKAQTKFYSKPTSLPDQDMIIYPLWSTWAQYFTNVNQEIVLNFASRIISEGFNANSHVEIDDNWESCYGEAQFHPEKFPDPAGMVRTLNEQNFRVTLWIHPFVNMGCPSYREGVLGRYFIEDQKDKTRILSWWVSGGENAGVMDFSNPEGVAWWKSRLERLRTEYGIDSFKFDAGESNYLPYAAKLRNGDNTGLPNSATQIFVDSVSSFGKMVEVRASRRNQHQAIFFRMFDKDSRWGYDNGLKSIIPTLLHFGILGYPFVLPDMIGGNAYGGRPSKELYIRWMQANALMPAVQISLVPWDYDAETVQITKDMLNLRVQYKDAILLAANQSLTGNPINRPMWWVDPEDENTYDIDSQYMLGDDILVAPVLDEGATTRDIYLPQGAWKDAAETVHQGPGWLRGYPAPLNTLPLFTKQA